MIELVAVQLKSFPVRGLVHVRDLVHFEGSLLSLFRHRDRENYLFYWCDCDDSFNRWMVLRVSEMDVIRLESRMIPLAKVIPDGALDDFVYFVDRGPGGVERAYLSMPSSVTDDYRPEPDAYLDESDSHGSLRSYAMLVQGDWEPGEFSEFPRTFAKVYSVLYAAKSPETIQFTSHPWRGGFSSMHFFNEIAASIPPDDRPILDAVQKSSPGYIRLRLDSKVAGQVVKCIADYKTYQRLIDLREKGLRDYIRHHGMNEINNADDERWSRFGDQLELGTKAMLSRFSTIDETKFALMCPRPFEAAKIALVFVKNIRDLANLERDGLVEYPKSVTT